MGDSNVVIWGYCLGLETITRIKGSTPYFNAVVLINFSHHQLLCIQMECFRKDVSLPARLRRICASVWWLLTSWLWSQWRLSTSLVAWLWFEPSPPRWAHLLPTSHCHSFWCWDCPPQPCSALWGHCSKDQTADPERTCRDRYHQSPLLLGCWKLLAAVLEKTFKM